MNYYFHELAEVELNESVSYYESKMNGLGNEFLDEVYATIQRILEYPKTWTSFSNHSRRCLCQRFPFSIIYQIRNETIVILAVSHLHRKPNYWKQRLTNKNI